MKNTFVLHLRLILKAKQIFLTSFHLLCASSFFFLDLLDLLGLSAFGLSCLFTFSVGLKTADFDSLRLESWVKNPHIFCIVSEGLLFSGKKEVRLKYLGRRRGEDWEDPQTRLEAAAGFLEFQQLPVFLFSITLYIINAPLYRRGQA